MKAVEEGEYASRASGQSFGLVRVEFDADLPAGAAERAAAGCFRAVVASFISFLDKLIAIRSVSQDGIRIERELHGYEEAIGYFHAYVTKRISETARNRSLTNPRKIDLFPSLSGFSKRAALGYFALRRCLEHHQGIPQEDIELCILNQTVFVDDVEVTTLPWVIKAGQEVKLKLVPAAKRFVAGSRVALSPADAYAIAFTIRVALAPEALGVRMKWVQGQLEQGGQNADGREEWSVRYSLAPTEEKEGGPGNS